MGTTMSETNKFVELPPSTCYSCRSEPSATDPLFMLNPWYPNSLLTWHCERCWKYHCGSVPGAVTQWPADRCTSNARPIGLDLSTVYVTDFGFPQPGMWPVYQVFKQRTGLLEAAGVHIINNVDATNAKANVDKFGEIWLCVWGSPHPNSFTEILPSTDVAAPNFTNGEYKSFIFRWMIQAYPQSNIVMPHPSYYELDGAVPMEVHKIRNVTYAPMASCTNLYLRLCGPAETKALCHGSDVVYTSTGTVDLRATVQRGLAKRKTIVFFGEYTSELSFTCCADV